MDLFQTTEPKPNAEKELIPVEFPKRYILKNFIDFFTNLVVSPHLFKPSSKIDVKFS